MSAKVRYQFGVVEFAALIFLLILFLSACKKEEKIELGFIGPLTGRVASLGISGRDGAILAIEEINEDGGIGGRSVELIIRDNKLDGKRCKSIIKEMVDKEVTAIIGPMTSSMGLVSVPLINFHQIPMIGPTVSTGELAGRDDFFFRVMPISRNTAERTAEYLFEERGFKRVHVVYDLKNSGFTEPWYISFKNLFIVLGGETVKSTSYRSETNYDFLSLAKQINTNDVDCLIFLTSAMDSALISQQLYKLDKKIQIIGSDWSATEDLVEYGGEAVEGFEFFHPFDKNNQSERYLHFADAFFSRFGYEPSFASAYSYNAVKVMASALAEGMRSDEIKRNLLKNSPYKGLQRDIVFDKYGDVQYDYYLLRVKNRKIITVKTDA